MQTASIILFIKLIILCVLGLLLWSGVKKIVHKVIHKKDKK